MKKQENNNVFASDDHRLANHLSGLLRKVLHHYDVDGLSQIILHELGHDNCFNLKKATYLVDNPDFNHLLGVAGYHCDECKFHKKDIWESPQTFKDDMKTAHYHNDVKNFLHDSLKLRDINLNDAKEVKDLGKNIGIGDPSFFSWNMKHGNHGLLIFEKNDDFMQNRWRGQMLANVASLLSFAGI